MMKHMHHITTHMHNKAHAHTFQSISRVSGYKKQL